MTFSLLERLRDVPLAVFDVETTGCSPRYGHRVTEIGVVRVEGGLVAARYAALVDPGRDIPPQITRITGICDAMVRGRPTFAEQWPDLQPVFADAAVVGHNVRFDLSFLTAELTAAGRPIGDCLGSPFVIDTLGIARRRFGRGGNSLGLLARRLGVEPTTAHRALADAETTAAVLCRLIESIGGWDTPLVALLTAQGGASRIDGSRPGTSRFPRPPSGGIGRCAKR